MNVKVFLSLSILLLLPIHAHGATVSVTTTTDELTDNDVCSLREAVITTNNDYSGTLGTNYFDECAASDSSAFGDDTISLPAGTYCLSVRNTDADDGSTGGTPTSGTDENYSATGDLDILGNLAISGSGATSTLVDAGGGSDTTCSSSLFDRVADVSASSLTVSITGVTIKGGKLISSSSTAFGGGLLAGAYTTLNVGESKIYQNTATGTGAVGGGLYTGNSSSLAIIDSTISENTATGTSDFGTAGGIYARGNITLTNTLLSENEINSYSYARGGGAYLNGTITFKNTTVFGNEADTSISYIQGSGIYVVGSVTISNSTISGNTASATSSYGHGGGIYASTSTTINLKNTLLSGNSVDESSSGRGAECFSQGTWNSYGYNFIASATTSGNCSLNSLANSGTDITNQSSTAAGLDGLEDNGGSTKTVALLTTSYSGLINPSAGADSAPCELIGGDTSTASDDLTTDQRGQTRDSSCDIGSYEVVCGDGQTGGSEECDDGNAEVEDECNSACLSQSLYCNDSDQDHFGTEDSSLCNYYIPTDVRVTGGTVVVDSSDCDDADASIHPGATETCGDGEDSDCNTDPDSFTLYEDADGDGYGTETGTPYNCDESNDQAGYVDTGTDCNDASASVNPGTTESCNSIDDDCDGTVDESLTTTYYADADSDGYGDQSTTSAACSQPTGYVTNDDDCNDGSSSVKPGATDTCENGTDEDCSGADATCPAAAGEEEEDPADDDPTDEEEEGAVEDPEGDPADGDDDEADDADGAGNAAVGPPAGIGCSLSTKPSHGSYSMLLMMLLFYSGSILKKGSILKRMSL